MSINDDVYFVLMSGQRDAGRDHSVEIIIKMYLFSVQMSAASFLTPSSSVNMCCFKCILLIKGNLHLRYLYISDCSINFHINRLTTYFVINN